MVKFLETPFGNYGYILGGNVCSEPFSINKAVSDHGKTFARIRHSVYDARYLRTTDLSKGSKIFKITDPDSYVKHGLLHDGQKLITEPLEQQLPRLLSKQYSRSASKSNLTLQSPEKSRIIGSNKFSATKKDWKWQEKRKEYYRHAGKPTLLKTNKGFARGYATNRALINYLGTDKPSYKLEETDEELNDDEDKNKNDKTHKKTKKSNYEYFKTIQIDPSETVLTKLNELKSQRLKKIYSDMYERMEKQRRSLIAERVHTTEKIKDSLFDQEREEQRGLLKSSVSSQRKQLRQVRHKYDKDFSIRLHSVYQPPTPKIPLQNKPQNLNNSTTFFNPMNTKLFPLSLPREVYGLPEADTELRPETVPSKHIYRFRKGKLSLQAYDQARNNLSTRFNNVWNKVSPTTTPRKSAAVSSS